MSLLKPIVVPPIVCNHAVTLEFLPKLPNGLFCQQLSRSSYVCLCKNQIEKRRSDVHRVPRTYDSDLRFEPLLKHELKRIVALPYPTSIVNDAFTLEPTRL